MPKYKYTVFRRPINIIESHQGSLIPTGMLSYPELTGTAKVVYFVMLDHRSPDGRCYLSQPSMATYSSMCERQIKRIVPELIKHGFIKIVGRLGWMSSNVYEFLDHPCFDQIPTRGDTYDTRDTSVPHYKELNTGDKSPLESAPPIGELWNRDMYSDSELPMRNVDRVRAQLKARVKQKYKKRPK